MIRYQQFLYRNIAGIDEPPALLKSSQWRGGKINDVVSSGSASHMIMRALAISFKEASPKMPAHNPITEYAPAISFAWSRFLYRSERATASL